MLKRGQQRLLSLLRQSLYFVQKDDAVATAHRVHARQIEHATYICDAGVLAAVHDQDVRVLVLVVDVAEHHTTGACTARSTVRTWLHARQVLGDDHVQRGLATTGWSMGKDRAPHRAVTEALGYVTKHLLVTDHLRDPVRAPSLRQGVPHLPW